jgi:hypothetical protein
MNLYEQLQVIQDRLNSIGAHDDSIALVEKLLKRAEPTRHDKTAVTQIQVLRHMLRMPDVIDNYNIYNDLQVLIGERSEVELLAREEAAPPAYEEASRRPRPRSFYKARKSREKKGD